jgi:D-alanine-D-alanine ligase
MSKIRVALIFGGQSEEHAVSIMTAREIMKAIDREKYEVTLFGIDRSGFWQKMMDIPEDLKALAFDHSGDKLPSEVLSGLQRDIDIVFPLLHGPYGEDGRIQGLFDMMGLPYAGCDLMASALCMDKDYTKKILKRIGIPVTASFTYREYETIDVDEIIKCLGLPIFVKPVNLGSSVGITKAKTREELSSAITLAFKYDGKVIIEEAINARELECAVLGNNDPEVSPVGEIIPSHEFYDYEAKYFDGGQSKLLIPADIDKETRGTIRTFARKAYQELGCKGLSRIDFFMEKETGEIYLNEINTMPGFTPFSMYPQLWKHGGIDYADLIDRLIMLGMA